MRRTRLVAVAIALAACGGASAPPSLPPKVVTADAGAAAEPAIDAGPTLPPEPTGVASIEPPESFVCSFAADVIDDACPLRAVPTGAPFAVLRDARASVKLLPTGAWFVEAQTGAVRVSGYVEPSDARRLLSKRAITMSDWVVAAPSAAMHVVPADGKLVAKLETLVAGVASASGVAPSADVTCDDIAVARASFDARAALPDAKNRGLVWFLRDREVPLSTAPGAPPVARLTLGEARIDILEQRGATLRVAIEFDDRVLFGWIPAASAVSITQAQFDREMLGSATLGTLAALGTAGALTTATTSGAHEPPPIDELRCTNELRAIVEWGPSARWFVGTIGADAVVRVAERGESLTRVTLPSATRGDLTPAKPFAWLVPTRDLASCATQPITSDGAPPPRPPPAIAQKPQRRPRPPPPPPKGGPGFTPGTYESPEPPRSTAPRGSVSRGGITSSVPMKDLERTIATQLQPKARACYQKALQDDATLQGRIVLRFVIGPNGDVSTATVAENTLGSTALATCIVGVLRKLVFSPPEGGSSAIVMVPINFVHQ
jgi:outer membrane biosynthesis protein TonB